MIKKTIIEMGYEEFEDLVDKHIIKDGTHYEYVASEELSNDSTQSYNDINGTLDNFERQSLDKDDHGWKARTYLKRLCELGIIEAGDYVITVCW